MIQGNPFKLLGIADSLLIPIQRLIERLIPDFIEQDLCDETVRRQIVKAVDAALTAEYPAARAVPEKTRHRIIRKLLDLLIDDILIPEDERTS